MSLTKFLAKHAHTVGELAKEHKGALAAAAAIPAVAGGAYAAQPSIDDFMTDQAIKSMGRNAKRGLVDAAQFAEKHPYITAGALGGSGALGATMGDEGFSDLFDSFSPIKIGHHTARRKQR